MCLQARKNRGWGGGWGLGGDRAAAPPDFC